LNSGFVTVMKVFYSPNCGTVIENYTNTYAVLAKLLININNLYFSEKI